MALQDISILLSRVLNVITIATNPTPKFEENEFIALEFADFASVMLLLIALLILFLSRKNDVLQLSIHHAATQTIYF